MKRDQLPVTLKPGEGIEMEISLTPEAIERINSGKAITMNVVIDMPLPVKCVMYPLAFYGAYTLVFKILTWIVG